MMDFVRCVAPDKYYEENELYYLNMAHVVGIGVVGSELGWRIRVVDSNGTKHFVDTAPNLIRGDLVNLLEVMIERWQDSERSKVRGGTD